MRTWLLFITAELRAMELYHQGYCGLRHSRFIAIAELTYVDDLIG